jgi:hypothetical protein
MGTNDPIPAGIPESHWDAILIRDMLLETSGKHWTMGADACGFRTRLQATPTLWLYNFYLVSLSGLSLESFR